MRNAAAAKSKNDVKADPVFGPLDAEKVDLASLQQAWTFTVASTRNLTERMVHIRDDAFKGLGAAGAPAFTVDKVTDGVGERTRRRITGTFTVPSYLTVPKNGKDPVLGADAGLPGTRFAYLDGDELPDRTGDFTATYTCNLPPNATGSTPARGSIYGHGLLGGQGEVNGGNIAKLAVEGDIVFCATDWYGMATGDVPNVATMLADMSNFPTLPDRVQQGMLAHLFLARLLKSPAGFASNAAFQEGGRPAIETGAVYYDGNSQGGIIGGALMAVAQDITRGALGVPGMNYSTLLDRSVDFATYEAVFNAAYPSERDRQIVFALIQGLWDRAETNGYAAHITKDLLPGTPEHQVLLHPAYGDHQVANAAAEVMARTIGASTNEGFLEPGRHWSTGLARMGPAPLHRDAPRLRAGLLGQRHRERPAQQHPAARVRRPRRPRPAQRPARHHPGPPPEGPVPAPGQRRHRRLRGRAPATARAGRARPASRGSASSGVRVGAGPSADPHLAELAPAVLVDLGADDPRRRGQIGRQHALRGAEVVGLHVLCSRRAVPEGLDQRVRRRVLDAARPVEPQAAGLGPGRLGERPRHLEPGVGVLGLHREDRRDEDQRSSFLRIFPVGPLGSSSTTRISRGYL